MKKISGLLFSIISLFSINSLAQEYEEEGGLFNTNTSFTIEVDELFQDELNEEFILKYVCVFIEHPDISKLALSLRSPDGTELKLTEGQAFGDLFDGTCFEDDAQGTIPEGEAPYDGEFVPQFDLLFTFSNGQSGIGEWQLIIEYLEGADEGELIEWRLGFETVIDGEVVVESSNLPLIFFDTNGEDIVDEPSILAQVKVIDNGAGNINYVDDSPTFEGHVTIEFRGASSLSFPKKSYGFETSDAIGNDIDTTFLGLPSEEDWILHSSWTDKTHLRNALAMKIAREMDNYASKTRHCEVFVNDEYIGLYVLMEKIKRDKNRVDIAKLNADENDGDNVTGGYIVKLDWNEDAGWESEYNTVVGDNLYIQYVYPKGDEITPQQETYIQNYFKDFEDALFDADYTNDQGKHYTEYMDTRSFVEQFIVNELAKDVDGYKLSTFIHKDKDSKGGKLTAGPIWDYDIAWYNSDYCAGGDFTGWNYNENDCEDLELMPRWWNRLMADPVFVEALCQRWSYLRENTLSTIHLMNYIDTQAAFLEEAQTRNFQRWNILEEYTWGHPVEPPGSYAGEVENLKWWLENRLAWMDNNLTGNCQAVATTAIDVSAIVEIYPNPITNLLTVELTNKAPLGNIEFAIYDLVGKQLFVEKITNNSSKFVHQLDSKKLSKGMYIVKLSNQDFALSKKIVKE